jgi:hypothetical protein
MTKAFVIGLAAVVWSAGFAATGALVHVLDRPLPQPLAANVAAPARIAPPPVETREPEVRHVVLPTVEIVATIPRAAPKKQPPHELKCSEWRPLEQGSNSVQICE